MLQPKSKRFNSENLQPDATPSSPNTHLDAGPVSNSWEGFLPPHAIVMARRKEIKIEVETSQKVDSFEIIAKDLQNCTRCPLCTHRRNIVFGEGNQKARLVFVGEGPGEQEDLQGRPFVGPAGQLLDRMIAAIGLRREEVFIANVVKCRPPRNRNPEPIETETCGPFLHRQLDLIQPKVIVALGKFAAQTLVGTTDGITRLRGRFFNYRGARLMPTFHPAYLLRNPSAKREVWNDLQLVAKELEIEIPHFAGLSARVPTRNGVPLASKN